MNGQAGRRNGWMLVAVGVLAILPACSMSVKDAKDGDKKQVDIDSPVGKLHVDDANKKVTIDSPVGSMHVDAGAVNQDYGVPMYPGATPRKSDSDGDKHSANVNMDTPWFGLRVVAGEFETGDSPQKVLAFYRDALKKYGTVLECEGGADSSVNVKEGKNNDDADKPVSCAKNASPNSTHVELKVGTEHNQHVVGVEPLGNGSRFGMAYVRIHGGKNGDSI